MSGSCSLRIGPAGWSYDDWRGVVYPEGMPKSRHPVEYLSTYFDTIEINSSFYRPVNPRHAETWAGQCGGNAAFRFTAKLWQGFTHERERWPGAMAARDFMNGIQPLVDAGRFGCLLVQFPWSFRRTRENRAWLARIIETFRELPLAVEVRHSSWDTAEVYEGFRTYDVAFCNIDQPLFRDSIGPSGRVTSGLGYIRLHGRNVENWFRENAGRDERYNYLYSGNELAEWEERIKKIEAATSEVYVITNNHYAGQAVVNAFELQFGLLGRRSAIPDSLLSAYPRLRRLDAAQDRR